MKPNSTQQTIFNIIISLTGQRNVLTIPRVFIDMTESLGTALFLNQLIYWADKGTRQDGFIYKSRREWTEEISLSDYAIRKATSKLETMGILETKKLRANGAPTLHYRLDFEALVDCLSRFVETVKTDSSNSTNPFVENDKSIPRKQQILNRNYTETTTEQVSEESDDEWLKHSRIAAPEEAVLEPEPVAKSSDPFIRAVQNQQQANWADPADAGGADDYALAPVDAFCDLLHISTTKLPEKKRRDWAKALRGVAHEWGVGPPVLSQCISGIPDSEFHWKTYSTPWQDGFQADLGVLIGQVLAGNGPGDPRIIEVKSR